MNRTAILANTLVSAIIAMLATHADATPITTSSIYNLIDNIGPNSDGTNTGVRLAFGANAVPNGFLGTTATATQGSTTIPLIFSPISTSPNSFSRSIAYNPGLLGSWSFNFSNGTDTEVVTTPGLGGATVMPLVNNVKISGDGSTPTFSWRVPAGVKPDAVGITLRDKEAITLTGGSDFIYSKSLPGSTRSFRLDPTDPLLKLPTLEERHSYSIEIQLLDRRTGSAGTIANTQSRSRAFFDFTLLPPGSPADVVLPTLVLSPSPVFRFDTSVVAGERTFIDPILATGYDYSTGVGDPNFASVILPEDVGDGLYDLWNWNGTEYVDAGKELVGGVEYFFDEAGVSKFRIKGIETSAGLDPYDVTAFITGLTFNADGEFTGTMTPLTVEVPEPPSWALAAVALIALRLRRTKCLKQASRSMQDDNRL